MAEDFKLPSEFLDMLRDAKVKNELAKSAIRKGIASGLPVADLEPEVHKGADQLNKIRDQFFPDERL